MNNKTYNMNSLETKFNSLNIDFDFKIKTLSNENKNLLYQYLSQLSDIDKTALLIAANHLGSSFNIFKSIGYLKWKNNL
jgi:hypothetical protein